MWVILLCCYCFLSHYHHCSYSSCILLCYSVPWFVSGPELKGVWKHCRFLLDGPSSWSIQDAHHLVQREPSSTPVSCKGSFPHRESWGWILNTQGMPDNRESQPQCSTPLAQFNGQFILHLQYKYCCMYSSSSETCPFSVSADRENSIQPHEGSKDLILKEKKKKQLSAYLLHTVIPSQFFSVLLLKILIILQRSKCLILPFLF